MGSVAKTQLSNDTEPSAPGQMRRMAVLSSLALVCLGVVTSLVLLRGFERQLDDVRETFSVRTAASELSLALIEAEAQQRGYLLTGDEEFYKAYTAVVAGVEDDVSRLLAMTRVDEIQHSRLLGITGTISSKLDELERVVSLARVNEGGRALDVLGSGFGARMMNEVTQTLADFVTEEDLKLQQRESAIQATRTLSAIAMIASVLAAAVLAYSLLARTQRQVSLLAIEKKGLRSQNELLELQVAERTKVVEDARAIAEKERGRVETLLQDMNHRIGNSLATVSSLLALQAMRSGSPEVKTALDAARQRVHAIASAHRRLRLGDDLETASSAEFLDTVVEDIVATQSNRKVSVTAEIEPIQIGARDATTLGILVGELITNAIKHAFPDNSGGKIIVRLYRDAQAHIVLEVEDNGVGLGEHPHAEGLGSVIVKQLAGQFGGEPVSLPVAGGGLMVRIVMPDLGQVSDTAED